MHSKCAILGAHHIPLYPIRKVGRIINFPNFVFMHNDFSTYSMLRIFHLFAIPVICVSYGIQRHEQTEVTDPVIPMLSKHQTEAINKFEDHKIFARVWKEAGIKLAEEMREIQEKKDVSLRRHRKHRKPSHLEDIYYDI